MFFGAKLRNSVMRISRDEIKIKVFISVGQGATRLFTKVHSCFFVTSETNNEKLTEKQRKSE